jgi:hypothetical protein
MKTSYLTSTLAVLALTVPMALLAQTRSSSTPADSGSASASARQSGSTSGSATSTSAGLVLHNGSPYVVRNNQATRLDESTLRAGQMMTADGRLVDIPEGITGLNRLTSNVADSGSASATARQSGAISGSATSANVQDGLILKDGVPYMVRNGRATAVDTSSLQSGQMMTFQGDVTPMPQGVTGLEGSSRAGSSNRSSTSSDPSNRGSSSGTRGSQNNSGSSSTKGTRGSADQSSSSNSTSTTNPSR